MRIPRLFCLLITIAAAPTGFAQQTPAPGTPPTAQERVTHLATPGTPASARNANANILPDNFAGWSLQPPPRISKDPGAADPTNSALLKEYGFSDFEGATYTRDDGRKVTIKAARFEDA